MDPRHRDYALDQVIAKKLNHGGPVDLIVMPAGGGTESNITADWDYLPSELSGAQTASTSISQAGSAARRISSASRLPGEPSSRSPKASGASPGLPSTAQ